MKKLLQELIDNDSGLILSAELVLVLTIAVLGVVVGLTQIQTAVVTELQDISLALSGMNQSFGTPGFLGCRKWWGLTSFTAGSGFIDFNNGCVGGGAVGGGGGGFGGGYAEIGGGQFSGMGRSNVIAPPATIPCETCVPGAVTTPLPDHAPISPTPIGPTPFGPTQTLPIPPAPVPDH